MNEFVLPISDLVLDKSKINTYIACPKRYKLQYIDKVTPKPTIEASIGKIFHEVSARYYDELDKVDLQVLQTNFRDTIKSIIFGMVPDDIRPAVDELIANFVIYEYERWKCILNGVGLERALEYFKPLEREKYLYWDLLKLEGTIDRLYKDVDGSLMMLELKTGRYRPYTNTMSALKREIIIYCWLLRANNYDVAKGGLYFPRDNVHIVWDFRNNLNIQKFNKVLEKANKVREGILAGNFEKRVSGLCKYCTYSDVCLTEKG